MEIRHLSVLAFTKHGTEIPLAHALFSKMKVDFKKQNVRTFENFMSPRDSPRLIFCVLWRNYAYRTQDARLKKITVLLILSLYNQNMKILSVNKLGNDQMRNNYSHEQNNNQLPCGCNYIVMASTFNNISVILWYMNRTIISYSTVAAKVRWFAFTRDAWKCAERIKVHAKHYKFHAKFAHLSKKSTRELFLAWSTES